MKRQNETRGERPRLPAPTSFLSRMRLRFLNNQWCFCHMRHNPKNQFEFERECEWLLNLSARLNFKWTNQSWGWNDLERPLSRTYHKSLRKAEEVNFKANVSFFMSLSTAEAHVFGVKFIGLYGTVGLLWFGTFLFEKKSDLWTSDVWPAMDGVISLLASRGLSRRGKN